MKPNVIVIHVRDTVAIALEDIQQGSSVHLPDGGSLRAQSDIPYSHKIALKDLTQGEDIIKYGEIIGQAKQAIARGEWIHTHNLVVEE